MKREGDTNEDEDGKGHADPNASPGLCNIRRLLGRAKPAANHERFEEWQTTKFYVVLRDDDEMLAKHRAIAELKRQRWELLELTRADTLIESRVQSEGGEVWEDYLSAVAGEVVVRVFPEHLVLEHVKGQRFLPLQITEDFFDEVIVAAGGRRISELLPADQRNADYLLGETVFELKTLEEDRLQKDAPQVRLAQLFAPYYPDSNYATIDPNVLTDRDRRIYADILSVPIKSHVAKASSQVKSTRAALGGAARRGGLIMLNVGFPALNHELFADQVRRFAAKDSSQFDDVISICVWVETNGFDTSVHYAFEPRSDGSAETDLIRAAFQERFERLMTDLLQGKQAPNTATMIPGRPVAFSIGGLRLRWEPITIPLSIST